MARAGAATSPAALGALLEAVNGLAAREAAAMTAVTAQVLSRPVAELRALSGENGAIARDLAELGKAATQLDAGAINLDERPRRRLLGMLPPGDAAGLFLDRSERLEDRVQPVIGRLREAQQALRSDTAAIGQHERALAAQTGILRRAAALLEGVDRGLPGSAPPGLRVAVVQRRRDLLTQLAVALQGEAALRVVADNNEELTRAIESAVSTASAALQVAIVVRQALLAQRVVRKRVHDARDVLGGARDANALQVEALKSAWAALEANLAETDRLRQRAVDSLAASAAALASPPGGDHQAFDSR